MGLSLQNLPGMSNSFGKIAYILLFAFAAHLLVLAIHRISRWFVSQRSVRTQPKTLSIASLTHSFIVFSIYFWVIGFILQTLGVSLTAYLASASVIGLAVGFGSQGLVQDVVTGLTLVFSNLLDVGDMVEIGGQTGLIRSIGMRFVLLENSMGAEIFIPNRSITNVINYPKGYVRCLVDVPLPDGQDRTAMTSLFDSCMNSFVEQFPGLFIHPPSIEEDISTRDGRKIARLKFRIWPGRGGPLETTFKSKLLQKLREAGIDYPEWMISVYYEVERKQAKQ
jgi:small conductance mechanosensitive channel